MGLIKVVNNYQQPDLVPFCKPHLHRTSGLAKQGAIVFHLGSLAQRRRRACLGVALGRSSDKETRGGQICKVGKKP